MSQHPTRPIVWALFAALAATAAAQSSSSPAEAEKKNSADPTSAEAKPVVLDKVEVTGSRIRSLVGEQPALPLLSFSSVDLERRGVTRLADIRWAVPQLAPSIGFNDNLANGGPSRAQQVSTNFNLRGLGGNSTLVLIDGHRVPRSGQEMPGGAGGREDFNIDGIPVSAIERIEILPQGAGAIYGSEAIAGVVNIILKKNYTGGELQFSYGSPFDTNAAETSVSLTGGYRSGKLTTFATVSYSQQNALAASDRWFSRVGSSLEYEAYAGAGSLSTGYYPIYATENLPGLSTGTVAVPAGSSGSGFTAAEAAATPLGEHFDPSAYTNLIDESSTRSVLFKGDYAYASWLRPYVDVRWSKFKNTSVFAPITLVTQLPVGYAGNPFSVPVYLQKVFYDLPRPVTDSSQENLSLGGGIRGDLPAGWRYDANATWSRNTVRDEAHGTGFDSTKLAAAMAATTPVILAYDSATVADPNPDGLLASLLASSSHKDVSDVTDALVSADGPIWTGWAGDVKLAVGGETQREKVTFFRNPVVSYGLSAPFQRTINAVFGEIAVPLLSDAQKIPFVHSLTVSGAARREDYSDLGPHTSPSIAAQFQPLKWLTLRASRTEGFKSPTLYSLAAPDYTSPASSWRTLYDPLRGGTAIDLTNVTDTTGGKPDLRPETSVSRNAGVVIDVPLVKGLSLSADWWDLSYTDKVDTPSYQTLIAFFPERVTRGANLPGDTAGWAGPITAFDSRSINLSRATAKGVDLSLSYQRVTAIGEFLLTGSYTKQDPQASFATPASSPYYVYYPKRLSGSLYWTRGAWGAGVSVNYQGRYFYIGPAYPDYSYPPYIEWNPQVSYNFGHHSEFAEAGAPWWQHALAGTKISLTVINVFDKDPDKSQADGGITTMDPRLRRFVVTLTKKF